MIARLLCALGLHEMARLPGVKAAKFAGDAPRTTPYEFVCIRPGCPHREERWRKADAPELTSRGRVRAAS